MKFSEMQYVRPDIEKVRADLDAVIAALGSAKSADEQISLYKKADEIKKHTMTMATIASVRHSIDTRDEFYTAENDFMDENSPALQEKIQQILEKMLTSPFRAELEEKLGGLFFRNLEIAAKTFKPEIMTLMQEENALVSEYQALYASMTVEFDGKVLPLTKLGPYKQSTDRAVRKAACEVSGRWFDAHQEELDTLYGLLEKMSANLQTAAETLPEIKEEEL